MHFRSTYKRFVNSFDRRQDELVITVYTYKSPRPTDMVVNLINPPDTQLASSNFSFLEPYETLLPKLGTEAERFFAEDPATCIIKLRQFADLIAQRAALALGISFNPANNFMDLVTHLKARGVARQVLDVFYRFSIMPNDTVNGVRPKQSQALHELKLAKALAEWYVRLATNDHNFMAPPFVVPPDSEQVAKELQEQLEELSKRMSLVDDTPPERPEGVDFDLKTFNAQLAKSSRIPRTRFRIDQTGLDSETVGTFQLTLSEEETAKLIEEQLCERGWEADASTLRFDLGTRPARGRNMAIASWPTENGVADYALFVGTKCVGVVEAKQKNDDVKAALHWSEQYSRGFKFVQGAEPLEWPCAEHRVPFILATNGKSYVKQIEKETGVWFRDTRLPVNESRALAEWPLPQTLARTYEIDGRQAHALLAALPMEFGFAVRNYQLRAIEAIETALAKDSRQMLVAMASGAGKTKTTIALLYRLLSTKRIRSVCYVVDGHILKKQAMREFRTTNVMADRTIADAFGVEDFDNGKPDLEKRVHICTIQDLMGSVLHGSGTIGSADQYDLIVLDECHYGLRYRHALEQIDSIKLGLTATPTRHTVDLFGEAIYNYSYREGVLSGYLVDHEPPIQLKTAHVHSPIQLQSDEAQAHSMEIDLACVPDDVDIDVDYFDQRIGTSEFNNLIAQDLANRIDLKDQGKTLVFARDDAHAEILVGELTKAFKHAHGNFVEDSVQKITAKMRNASALIDKCSENDLPKVIVTDDLMASGVNIPSIENVVLIRRVKSRILYEQMLGRATRPCEEIGKQRFRIFDAVDLYKQFAPISSMTPITVNPTVSMKQLFEQIQRLPDELHRHLVYQQIIVKMRMLIKQLDQDAVQKYLAAAGELPEQTLSHFLDSTSADVADWLKEKGDLGQILESSANGAQRATTSAAQPSRNTTVGLKTIIQSVRSYLPR